MTHPPGEYSVLCETCSWGRKFGAAKVSAEQAATRHWMRHYDHVVLILRTEVLHKLTRSESAYHQLGDEAPF